MLLHWIIALTQYQHKTVVLFFSKGPPIIIISPEDTTLNMSQDAVLQCQADAYPSNLTYEWLKQGQNVYHIEWVHVFIVSLNLWTQDNLYFSVKCKIITTSSFLDIMTKYILNYLGGLLGRMFKGGLWINTMVQLSQQMLLIQSILISLFKDYYTCCHERTINLWQRRLVFGLTNLLTSMWSLHKLHHVFYLLALDP